jgi:hypothetical protein
MKWFGAVLGFAAVFVVRPAAAQDAGLTPAVFIGANYPGAPSYLPNRPWVGASLVVPVVWRLDFYPAIEVHGRPAEGNAIRTLMAVRVRPFAGQSPLDAGAGVLAHGEGMAASFLAGAEVPIHAAVRPFGEMRLRGNPTFLDLVVGFRFRS